MPMAFRRLGLSIVVYVGIVYVHAGHRAVEIYMLAGHRVVCFLQVLETSPCRGGAAEILN